MNKAERKAQALANTEKRLSNHLAELKAIGFKGNYDQLEELEGMAHRTAEQECNGEINEEEARAVYMEIETLVGELFGGVPFGFFINTDPRGYALKLKDGTGSLSEQDWGKYEILAPDIKAEEMTWATV